MSFRRTGVFSANLAYRSLVLSIEDMWTIPIWHVTWLYFSSQRSWTKEGNGVPTWECEFKRELGSFRIYMFDIFLMSWTFCLRMKCIIFHFYDSFMFRTPLYIIKKSQRKTLNDILNLSAGNNRTESCGFKFCDIRNFVYDFRKTYSNDTSLLLRLFFAFFIRRRVYFFRDISCLLPSLRRIKRTCIMFFKLI